MYVAMYNFFLLPVSSALETTTLPRPAHVQRAVIVLVVLTPPVRFPPHLELSLLWEQLPRHLVWREQINKYVCKISKYVRTYTTTIVIPICVSLSVVTATLLYSTDL